MLTDLAWARAARAAASAALARRRRSPAAGDHLLEHDRGAAVAAPGAIRFDAPSAATGPGRHGLWQRPLERRRLERAPLLLPWSEGGAARGAAAARRGDRALVRAGAGRAVWAAAAASATSPRSPTPPTPPRRASIACSRRGGACAASCRRASRGELVVAGASRAGARARRRRAARRARACASSARSPREQYRALLRRARVFVCAPRREDYGIAQLEALADGCLLVTTPAPGPYAALPIARALDPRLVGEDLAGALRTALDEPRGRLRARAPRGARAVHAREPSTGSSPSELLPRLLSCARLRSVRSSAPRARVGDVLLASATRAARWPRPSACSRACACGARRSRSRSCTPARAAARACTSERSRRSGLALISSIVPRARGGREHGVEVDRVRARGARSAARWGGRSRRPAGARSRRSCARSSPARPSRRPCARSRSPSRARASSSSS